MSKVIGPIEAKSRATKRRKELLGVRLRASQNAIDAEEAGGLASDGKHKDNLKKIADAEGAIVNAVNDAIKKLDDVIK